VPASPPRGAATPSARDHGVDEALRFEPAADESAALGGIGKSDSLAGIPNRIAKAALDSQQ